MTTFEIPESARRAIEDQQAAKDAPLPRESAPADTGGRIVKWRLRETDTEPERWVEAVYTAEDFALAREHAKLASRKDDEYVNVIDAFHELKVRLGASLVGDVPSLPGIAEYVPTQIEADIEAVMPADGFDNETLFSEPSQRPGRFYGWDATATEREAGLAAEEADLGPLKTGSAAHSVLQVYGDGERRTSYGASREACGDFHARRRESTRLLTRGFLVKQGTLPNPAPGGREHVDAYVITDSGRVELRRLGTFE